MWKSLPGGHFFFIMIYSLVAVRLAVWKRVQYFSRPFEIIHIDVTPGGKCARVIMIIILFCVLGSAAAWLTIIINLHDRVTITFLPWSRYTYRIFLNFFSQMENANGVMDTVRGVGKCPYSPLSNITAMITLNGQYFAGSPMDFSGVDSAIVRDLGASYLRTKNYDAKWLNEPQFVGSFETDSYVYFLFREAAVEYINCGKVRDLNKYICIYFVDQLFRSTRLSCTRWYMYKDGCGKNYYNKLIKKKKIN